MAWGAPPLQQKSQGDLCQDSCFICPSFLKDPSDLCLDPDSRGLLADATSCLILHPCGNWDCSDSLALGAASNWNPLPWRLLHPSERSALPRHAAMRLGAPGYLCLDALRGNPSSVEGWASSNPFVSQPSGIVKHRTVATCLGPSGFRSSTGDLIFRPLMHLLPERLSRVPARITTNSSGSLEMVRSAAQAKLPPTALRPYSRFSKPFWPRLLSLSRSDRLWRFDFPLLKRRRFKRLLLRSHFERAKEPDLALAPPQKVLRA
jgi:hypothetical protein